MSEEKTTESLSIKDVLGIWSDVTGQENYVTPDQIEQGLYPTADIIAPDGGFADLRLYRRTEDWLVYVNDMGLNERTESSVRLVAGIVRKLRLQGVNIGSVRVQGAYNNSEELMGMINKELGE